MRIRLVGIGLKLYIGDLPWEKTHLQKIDVTLEINVRGKPPDYWAVSKALIKKFSGSHYEWVEDLALAMKKFLNKKLGLRGTLLLSKYPTVPLSPRIFQVDVSL
ncbi:MAG: hypothetical protein HYT79_11530 [Elusimicrobia bacterium]|nr:hypothetical protein [Elusimicrobiota bacterium]